VAGVANFAPYIGAVCTAGALLLAGASAFDTWQAALVPSLVFCLITMFEGQIFTPAVLGHRLSVPPPVVLIAVLFFGWLWGIVGALIAVPLLIIIRRVWLQSRAYQRSRTVEKSGSPYPVERLATRKTVISLAAD
jgi:predicted PurR-regulated permease PerM